VMMPADRVSTHDLPLAESLSAAVGEREKYHNITPIHNMDYVIMQHIFISTS